MFRGVSCNFTQDDQLKSYWEGNTYMKTCKRCESRSCRSLWWKSLPGRWNRKYKAMRQGHPVCLRMCKAASVAGKMSDERVVEGEVREEKGPFMKDLGGHCKALSFYSE